MELRAAAERRDPGEEHGRLLQRAGGHRHRRRPSGAAAHPVGADLGRSASLPPRMPRGNGFTRRGLFGAGAAGAVAAGLSACGDDYFDPATSHGTDVAERRPDLHGLHARGLHRPLQQAFRLRQPARGHAEPRRARQGLAGLQDGRAGGDAHRAGAPRPPHRRALVPVPQLRAHAGTARRPGLDLDPGQPADRDGGARRGRRRDRATARTTRSWSGRGSPTSGARSTSSSRASPRARTASSTSRSSARRRAARSSATCCPELSDSVEVGRLRSMVGWNSIYRDTDTRLPDRPRLPQRHQPRGRPEEEAPVLPRRGRLRPARAARRAARYSRTSTAGPRASRRPWASRRSSPSRRPTRG